MFVGGGSFGEEQIRKEGVTLTWDTFVLLLLLLLLPSNTAQPQRARKKVALPTLSISKRKNFQLETELRRFPR